MPKDDWNRLKSRDRGQKALQSGNYARPPANKPRKPKLGKKRKRRSWTDLRCPDCGHTEVVTAPQIFADGSEHTRVSCAECGTFIKWF